MNREVPVKTEQLQEKLRKHLPELAKQYDVETIGIFGSYVRGDEKKTSDLDLLVTFTRKPGMFKYLSLENHLSDLLGVKVDLVMDSALKKRIGDQIRSEVLRIA